MIKPQLFSHDAEVWY